MNALGADANQMVGQIMRSLGVDASQARSVLTIKFESCGIFKLYQNLLLAVHFASCNSCNFCRIPPYFHFLISHHINHQNRTAIFLWSITK